MAGAAPTTRSAAAPSPETATRITLHGLRAGWADRVLPSRPRPFLAVVAAVCVGLWLLGLLLAEDAAAFLRSAEWQVQPLYLAAHLVVLRLFVSAYAGGFLGGCVHMDMPRGAAERHARTILGPRGVAAALVLAAPLVWMDAVYLAGSEYLDEMGGMGAGGARNGADWLLLGIWSLEWVVNAYVWVVLVGFAWRTLRVLRRHSFRAPVERVLRERHYRPFLLMSARGATLVLGLSLVSGLYVWLAAGELSDYLGLGITAALLLAGFVPPWIRLRAQIGDAVEAETEEIVRTYVDHGWMPSRGSDEPPPADAQGIAARLDSTLALLRVQYLERLHAEVGKVEGKAVLIRLLAPAATVAWRLVRPG